MYQKQIEWLEDINLDLKLNHLAKLRKDQTITLCYIKYEMSRLHTLWSALDANYTRAILKHNAIDLQMAEIDGRLLIIENIPKIIKKESKVKNMVKAFSKKEREQLIIELSNMGKE